MQQSYETHIRNENKIKAKIVLIAGATGYAGKNLVDEFVTRSKDDGFCYKVKALVRRQPDIPFPDNVDIVIGEATSKDSIKGVMNGVDMVVSALGITRQKGMTYQEVDYQANSNLLQEALRSGVKQFAYIHVIHGSKLADAGVVSVAAKQAFVDELQEASSENKILSTVVCPTGFFSDMTDFLDMAKSGRVYLFGNGSHCLNPIHGSDLAKSTINAIEQNVEILSVGGPTVYTHRELAKIAFEVLDKPVRITYLWDSIRKLLLATLPWITPISVYGPAQFFLQAFGMDMVGDCFGTHDIKTYWTEKMQV